jgi:hypothetical protein
METENTLIQQVKGILDELAETGGRDKQGRDHRRSLAKLLMALMAKIPVPESEIARRLGISDFTISRWTKGQNAPRSSQIEQLRRIVELEEKPEIAPLIAFGEHARLIGVYPFDHFFQRVADPRKRTLYVSDVYVFKSLLGFHAGVEHETAAALYELLSEEFSGAQKLTIHYIYLSEFKGRTTAAHETFTLMHEEHLLRDVRDQLKEHRIRNEQKDCETLVTLGLGYSHLGYFVLLYNNEGKDRYGRDLDIWVECPVQRYAEAQKFFDREGPEYLFIELPHTMVSGLWKTWKQALDDFDERVEKERQRADTGERHE